MFLLAQAKALRPGVKATCHHAVAASPQSVPSARPLVTVPPALRQIQSTPPKTAADELLRSESGDRRSAAVLARIRPGKNRPCPVKPRNTTAFIIQCVPLAHTTAGADRSNNARSNRAVQHVRRPAGLGRPIWSLVLGKRGHGDTSSRLYAPQSESPCFYLRVGGDTVRHFASSSRNPVIRNPRLLGTTASNRSLICSVFT